MKQDAEDIFVVTAACWLWKSGTKWLVKNLNGIWVEKMVQDGDKSVDFGWHPIGTINHFLNKEIFVISDRFREVVEMELTLEKMR